MKLWPSWYTPPRQSSACDIIAFVAREFGFTVPEVKGYGRNNRLVAARSIITVILRESRGLSYAVIGRLLGGRDHTTIQHSYKSFQHKLRAYPDWVDPYRRAAARFAA